MEYEEVAFAPGISRHLVGQFLHPLRECPLGFAEFDRACFPEDFAALQQASASFLKDHSRAQDSIAIFPYQTRYGLAARRNVAGGLMQAYTASGVVAGGSFGGVCCAQTVPPKKTTKSNTLPISFIGLLNKMRLSFIPYSSAPSIRGSARNFLTPLRCAATGCTSRCDPCARLTRS